MSPTGSKPRRPEGAQGALRDHGGALKRPSKAVIRRRRAVVGTVVGLLVATAVASATLANDTPPHGSRTSVRVLRAGRASVGIARCSFVERTAEPTYDYLTGSMSMTRRIVVDLLYPSLGAGSARPGPPEPDRARQPFPLVLFASGYRLDPLAYAPLLDAWVRSGIVIAAPVFPYTNPAAVAAALRLEPAANPEDDLANEPADVAFVAREVLAASAGAKVGCPLLDGLVERDEVGLAGQSDGGQVAGMLGYDEAVHDDMPRLAADEVLSGVANGDDPYAGGPSHPALLVVQSSKDTCNTLAQADGLYDEIDQEDKWFLEDHARSHLGPYVGTSAAFDLVAEVTTRFFDLELHKRGPGVGFLALGNRDPSLARLRQGGSGPAGDEEGDGGLGCYER